MSEIEQLEASLTWAKHATATRWCAVERFAGGSVHTRCAGRFSLRDTWAACGEPPVAERCQACAELSCSSCATRLLFSARQRGDGLCGPCSRKRVEAGLVEIKHALVVETRPAPLWEATMLDERFDDGGES